MAQDHAFDIVSKVDDQELRNAIQQARKEMQQRYDFKKSKASIEFDGKVISLLGEDEHRLKAVSEILQTKIAKRKIPLKAFSFKPSTDAAGGMRRQPVEIQQGIPTEKAREIVKLIKGLKLKVQVAIQGEQLRVSGKKLDVLQEVIATLKERDLGINMDFENYR